MTTVGSDVFTADSFRGIIWRLNIFAREYGMTINEPLLKVGPLVLFGINGVRAHRDTMYSANF